MSEDGLAEFRRLIEAAAAEVDATAASVELLLDQLEPERARLLRLCAIPHAFNAVILRALAPELDGDTAHRRCEGLGQLSIVVDENLGASDEESYALHDEARHHLFGGWLAPERRDELREVSSRLVALIDGQLDRATQWTGDRDALERSRMFHLIGADPRQGLDEFERVTAVAVDHFCLDEVDSLVGLAREYEPVLSATELAHIDYWQGVVAAERELWDQAETLLDRACRNASDDPELLARALHLLGMVSAMQRDWYRSPKDQHAHATQGRTELRLAYLFRLAAAEDEQLLEYAQGAQDLGDLEPVAGLDLFHVLATGSVPGLSVARDIAQLDDNSLGMVFPAVGDNRLGIVQRKLGDAEVGKAAFAHSLLCFAQTASRFLIVNAFNHQDALDRDLRKWTKTEAHVMHSLEIKLEMGDTHEPAISYAELMPVDRMQTMPGRTREMLPEAIALSREARDDQGAVVATSQPTRIQRTVSWFERARIAFARAIELFAPVFRFLSRIAKPAAIAIVLILVAVLAVLSIVM